MVDAGSVNKIDSGKLLILGGLGVAAIAVYEILKGGSSAVNPNQTIASTTNPQTTANSNPQQNPQTYYMPTVAPSNNQKASVSGGSSYYAINYAPVNTYAPYTSSYSSSSVSTSSSTTTSSTRGTLQAYSAGTFGTVNAASPHNNPNNWGI